MLDSFAPRVPNVDFFFDREILNDGGSNDSLRQPVFPISLRDDVDATTSSSNRNISRLRRPTLLSGGPSSGFATSENTPSGVGILSNFLAGNMVSGGHRCDMCDESIEGIRWHCEVCDDVDLCSECRDRGGITGALLEQGHRIDIPSRELCNDAILLRRVTEVQRFSTRRRLLSHSPSQIKSSSVRLSKISAIPRVLWQRRG